MFDKVITIDPGNITGYAVWRKNRFPLFGCFHVSKALSMVGQLYEMRTVLERIVLTNDIREAIIEGVGFWEGSDKSRTAAVRGNLMKLSYLVGVYIDVFFEHDIPVEVIEAREWKKSLSKEGTKYRVEKILNCKLTDSEHIIDAIGLGLSRDEEIWKLKKSIKFAVNRKRHINGWEIKRSPAG